MGGISFYLLVEAEIATLLSRTLYASNLEAGASGISCCLHLEAEIAVGTTISHLICIQFGSRCFRYLLLSPFGGEDCRWNYYLAPYLHPIWKQVLPVSLVVSSSPEQRSAKKPRIDTPSQGRVTARRNSPRAFDPKTRGWLIPANGKHPRDVIPSSTNICPFFVSKGYACEKNCGKEHFVNISQVPRDDMVSILDTLLATKAGWVNKNQVNRQFGRKYNPVFGPPEDQTAGA
jgi:hypothetical protein